MARSLRLRTGVGLFAALILLAVAGIGVERRLTSARAPDPGVATQAERPADLTASLEGAPHPTRTPGPPAVGGRLWTAWVSVTEGHGYGGAPVPGALVQAKSSDERAHVARTSADGTALLHGLPPGDVHVVVTAEGFAISEEDLLAPQHAPRHPHRVYLERARTLRGRVVGAEDARAISGVRVVAWEAGCICMSHGGPDEFDRRYGEALTDARGEFEVGGIPTQAFCSVTLLGAMAPGKRTCWFVASPEARDVLTLTLPAGGTVVGRVLDAAGRSVAGAEVIAELDRETADWIDPWHGRNRVELPARYGSGIGHSQAAPDLEDAWVPLTATSDARGRYVLDGLGLGERYAVFARHPAHAPSAPIRAFVLRRTDTRKTLDLELRPEATVVVKCHDARGRPWPGIWVRFHEVPESRQDRYGTTGTDGTTEFAVIPDQSYEARFEHRAPGGWLSETVLAQAGRREIVFHLDGAAPEKQAPLHVPSVLDRPRSERPKRWASHVARLAVAPGVAPPESIDLHSESKSSTTSTSMEWHPDAQGTTPLEWHGGMRPYRFFVEADGFVPLVHEVDASSGETVDMGTLRLDPGVECRGRIVTPDGGPLADAEMSVSFALEAGSTPPRTSRFSWRGHPEGPVFVRGVRTGSDGSFRAAGLPSGRVRVLVEDRRCLPLDTVVAIPSTEPARLVVRLGAVVAVRVVDAHGEPVTRCAVEVNGPREADEERIGSWPGEHGVTDVLGGFTARTEPGAITIRLGLARYEGPARQEVGVVVAEGDRREVRIVRDG